MRNPTQFADAVLTLLSDLDVSLIPATETIFRQGLLVLLNLEKLRVPLKYKVPTAPSENGHGKTFGRHSTEGDLREP